MYFRDEDTTQIAEFLENVRIQNKRVVVFEDGSKFYDSYFQKDCDILLNPQKDGGYAWDMLGEFDGNYLEFAKTIIAASDMDEKDRKNAEAYFFKMFSNLPQLVENATTSNVLNKLIFQPFKLLSSDLIGKLGIDNKDILEKYAHIRDYLTLKFTHLKPDVDCGREISILKYSKNRNRDILFISCFDNQNLMKTQKMIADFCKVPSSACFYVHSSTSAVENIRNSAQM
jgi:hypothetical protein